METPGKDPGVPFGEFLNVLRVEQIQCTKSFARKAEEHVVG